MELCEPSCQDKKARRKEEDGKEADSTWGMRQPSHQTLRAEAHTWRQDKKQRPQDWKQGRGKLFNLLRSTAHSAQTGSEDRTLLANSHGLGLFAATNKSVFANISAAIIFDSA